MARYCTESNATGVLCPECRGSELKTYFNCTGTLFLCTLCDKKYSLSYLVKKLDDKEFDKLDEAVTFRLSDRI